MSKKKSSTVRAKPSQKRSTVYLTDPNAYDTLCCSGYTSLAHNPEIIAGVNKICALVSSMTIHLMSNTNKGDVRMKNELAKKIDISPNAYMTRKTFIASVVRSLLLEGDGNAVIYPQTNGGLLENLIPLNPASISYRQDGFGYKIAIQGTEHDPADLMHIVMNPTPDYPWKGTGYRVALKDVANNLKQAAATEKGFMESKWKPSLVIKVDAMTDEFSDKAGRSKLLSEYIETSEAGQPWMIPAEGFDVTEVKPLSLQDLALSDAVQLDKRTVAAILDVPSFLLGVGAFNEAEWNNFINTRIKDICEAIQQELTRKLLINPNWYFKFNSRSLYSYDIEKLSTVGADMYTRGIMTGNEVRDWIGLTPKDGLDELIILENYIPAGMIGDQKKLKDKGSEKSG